jgi:ribonuclease D
LQVLHAAIQHYQQPAPGNPTTVLETSQGVSLLTLLQQLQLRHPRPTFEVTGKQRGVCRWAIRPLTLPMLEYAVGDVMHLPAAAAGLGQQVWEMRGLAMAARLCEGLLAESQATSMYGMPRAQAGDRIGDTNV